MTRDEHQRRREDLMQMMEPKSMAILPAASMSIRNRDVHYPYRPDSDFYYLTGFGEPDAVAALIPGREQAQYILFCRERDESKERWNGPIAGQKGAVAQYGADDSFPIGDLDDILPRMLEQVQRVYYAMGCNSGLDRRMSEWINRIRSKARLGIHGPIEFIALDHYLHELRLFKSSEEIQTMRSAAAISCQGHLRLMRSCRPGVAEYALEAEFLHECTSRGARYQAYSPIVGGGPNGCVLHYVDNRDLLRDGDLVLVDAGCEYDYYASDITRTFPVSGRFSPAQRELYELVLEAQQAALKKIKPGNHWNDPHQAAVRTLTRGLVELKILKGTTSTLAKLIREETYKPYYMHRTGHWLGMDVHDVGDYKVDGEWRLLEPGMCMTVEPGLYIAPDAKGVHKRWRGIGIRIEDDVAVTPGGHEVLTADIPKSVAEIEAIMGG
jgi:Xaa-Pro aminopeptidase